MSATVGRMRDARSVYLANAFAIGERQAAWTAAASRQPPDGCADEIGRSVAAELCRRGAPEELRFALMRTARAAARWQLHGTVGAAGATAADALPQGG